jgi:hypothetical protein
MSTHDIAPYRDSLDLLHRFVPTPLTGFLRLDSANVKLETNDLRFFPTVAALKVATASPFDDQPPPSCLWKIVRDADVQQELAEATTILSDDLVVYSMGPACLVAADRARREILSFIGASVDARAYQFTILPTLCRLTEFVTHSDSSSTAYADLLFLKRDQCNA